MRSARAALCCSRASISASVESRSDRIDARVADFSWRAATSASRLDDEPGDDPALLDRSRGHRGLDARRLRTSRAGAAAGVRHTVARRLDARGDPLVLTPDPAQQVEVVEEVGEARRAEHERERVGPVGHVQLANALLQPGQRDPVLPAEPLEAGGLVGDRPVERSEPRARRVELSFEHAQARLLGVDSRLELTHTPGDCAQLLGEDTRLALRVGGLATQRRDLVVDARLLRARVTRRGACGEKKAQCEKARAERLEAGSTTHQALFAAPRPVPSPALARSRSSARSASAASRRRTPTTAR